MVHFDFNMSDIDAFNVFSIMTGSLNKLNEEILRLTFEEVKCQDLKKSNPIRQKIRNELVWFKKRLRYEKFLIKEMKHTNIDD